MSFPGHGGIKINGDEATRLKSNRKSGEEVEAGPGFPASHSCALATSTLHLPLQWMRNVCIFEPIPLLLQKALNTDQLPRKITFFFSTNWERDQESKLPKASKHHHFSNVCSSNFIYIRNYIRATFFSQLPWPLKFVKVISAPSYQVCEMKAALWQASA